MRCYIGVDLGGTNLAVGIMDAHGTLLHKTSTPTRRELEAPALLDDIASEARRCVKEADLLMREISGLGIGVPGTVDSAGGYVFRTPNLKLSGTAVVQELRRRLGLEKIYLGNDADCAALGESILGDEAEPSSILITIGTGIGGGVVANGALFLGFNGGGTELGHMPLIYGGEKCGCGSSGCFEAYASATALRRETCEAMTEHLESRLWEIAPTLEDVTAKTPFDAARLGDATAKEVLEKYFDYLAAGINGLVNLFRPHAVILGGGVSREGETLLAPLRERLKTAAFFSAGGAPHLRCAHLGNDAGILGAALLCMKPAERKLLSSMS